MPASKAAKAQQARALRRANKLRSIQAEARRKIAMGANPIPIIRRTPLALKGMRAGHLIRAIPRIGRKRTGQIFSELWFDSNTRLGDLSDSARDLLIGRIEKYAPGTTVELWYGRKGQQGSGR